MTLDKFFEVNYPRMLSFAGTWLHTKHKYEIEEVVHFTIEYFYTKNDREKLLRLLEEKKIEGYFYKSLRTMCQSKTAPYHWNNRLEKTHYLMNENIENEVVQDEYDYDMDFLISYKYDTIIKLLYTEYFKGQFHNIEHWEYSKKIFLLFINENMSLNSISKKTNISLQTINYNFKKVRTVLINILRDEKLLNELIPGVNIKKLEESIDSKKINKYYMDYFTILTEFQQNCPGIKQTILKKAASQKAKHLSDGLVRDKVMIAIDVINHLAKCQGIISDKRFAIERMSLYNEYISPTPSPYKSTGCSSCMDFVSKQLNYIITKHREELYDISQ